MSSTNYRTITNPIAPVVEVLCVLQHLDGGVREPELADHAEVQLVHDLPPVQERGAEGPLEQWQGLQLLLPLQHQLQHVCVGHCK